LRRYLSLYRLFLLTRFKVLLEYRANFLIGAASTVLLQAAGLATLWVVMAQVPSLNGWSLDQVLLIYGFLITSRSIEHMFADNLWTLGYQYIRTGGFDRFLVRPINPLFHLLADRFNHDGIGNFLIGLALLLRAWTALEIPFELTTVLYASLALLSGGLIFIALNLLTATLSFWLIDSTPITLAVHQNHLFARFPLNIYPRSVQTLLTWVLPYGFCSFYPASYLMGQEVGWLAWAGPAVALSLGWLAYRFWNYGLRAYASTGS
jgi:ABC-2 type transport system permease protein